MSMTRADLLRRVKRLERELAEVRDTVAAQVRDRDAIQLEVDQLHALFQRVRTWATGNGGGAAAMNDIVVDYVKLHLEKVKAGTRQ